MRILASAVSVRFAPKGEGSRTRRDPVIASPSYWSVLGSRRLALGWHDLKRDLCDFTSRLPPGRNIALQ